MESFPPLTAADQRGLLAIGGDLSPERLVLAYRSGIFPWFNDGDPILWWSPDPRCVFFPSSFHPSRNLGKLLRRGEYAVTFDSAFDRVIHACAGPRQGQTGTWITQDMKKAYIALHRLGVAHSVECWLGGKLVGGLYGLALGTVFFGESMFSTRPDASKVALATLMQHLSSWGFTLVDCQVSSAHLLRLGAVEISRNEFVQRLESGLGDTELESNWQREPSAPSTP